MTIPSLPCTFLQAIARQEGFYIPGSRANRNNNPGNLNFAPRLATTPYFAMLETVPLGVAENPRFCHFRSSMDGFDAARALLLRAYLGLPVSQALCKWAPPSDDNDVSAYQANVCLWTGMSPDDVLTADNIG
jgi:hypothetical protein